ERGMLTGIPNTASRRNAQGRRAPWLRVAADAAAPATGACHTPPGEADINAQLCRRMWKIALVEELGGECKSFQFRGLLKSHKRIRKITKRTNPGPKGATAAAPGKAPASPRELAQSRPKGRQNVTTACLTAKTADRVPPRDYAYTPKSLPQ